MKLDLIAIHKLSPPGLWDTEALSAFISSLYLVMARGVGSRRVYGRMVLRFSRELREKIRDNLNMRIKAWVLQCPIRIAWVRGIIGETAIKRWQQNRLANYAFTRAFGDWKTKFSGGFARRANNQGRRFKAAFTQNMRTYTWKPFALVKTVNVYGFLYGQRGSDTERELVRAAYLKLWGVDIRDGGNIHKWRQPRLPRQLKPVEFTPYELVPEEAEDFEEHIKTVPEEEGGSSARIMFNPTGKPKLGHTKKVVKKPP